MLTLLSPDDAVSPSHPAKLGIKEIPNSRIRIEPDRTSV
jgi:hypothetical protein